MSDHKTHILFVCMGNICRSPVAEGVFLHLARERGTLDRFVVDSAGTGGWHAGAKPDRRSVDVAAKRGVHLPSIARQVTGDDFARFDYLIVMDAQNEEDLLSMGAPRDKVVRLMAYHPSPRLHEVPDPYYGGIDGFEHMYELIDAACRGLLDRLD
ncbi:MAG: low molecular weight phosphotyrosine protein phosphatase [Phycisphaerae bacterium]|nr:low molecular weight phosphotyrosine protein phosphatase [Phycisphaerae bacterium]